MKLKYQTVTVSRRRSIRLGIDVLGVMARHRVRKVDPRT